MSSTAHAPAPARVRRLCRAPVDDRQLRVALIDQIRVGPGPAGRPG